MKTNRRVFLSQSSAVALGALPSLVCRGASGADNRGVNRDGKVLVVIQMSGGNDGINTVVPYADEGYAKHRKELRLSADRLLKIDDSVALHPSMRGAADLLERGQLAIVQGVGYPNPSRSHDTSLAIWHSGEIGDENTLRSRGWLGKMMDAIPSQDNSTASSDPDMVLLGDESQPLAIQSRRSRAVTLSNLTDLRLQGSVETLLEPDSQKSTSGSLRRFVEQTMHDAIATASLLERSVEQSKTNSVAYPSTQLGGRLQTISALMKSGFQTPVYYAIQPGYDTHAAQLPSHSRLLGEFSGAIKAFLDDLESSRLSERVCVLGFSEFGRRVAENGSAGTDHGTAGPVFLAGNQVQPGLVGQAADLLNVVDADLPLGIDFRSVYQEIASKWLGTTLGLEPDQSIRPLNIFRV